MACLSVERRSGRVTGWRITWAEGDKRHTLRLGKIPKKDAKRVLVLIEWLITARRLQTPLSGEVAAWVEKLDDRLARRLAKLGLIPETERIPIAEFAKDWLEKKKQEGLSPGYMSSLGLVIKELLQCCGNITLDEFTQARAEAFRERLFDRGLEPATIRLRCHQAKAMFTEALRQKLIGSNPFDGIQIRYGDRDERSQYYIPIMDVQKVINALPSPHEKLLVALSRFAGLRVPSEVLSLRWQDIDWETDRMTVSYIKPGKVPGKVRKGSRVIPIFPMVKPYLQVVWNITPHRRNAWVFPEWRKRCGKSPHSWEARFLRSQVYKVIRWVGLKPWPRLWHNLRASCETDLVAAFPLATVVQWLYNTSSVARTRSTDDESFEKARQWRPPVQPNNAAQKPAQ